MRTECCCQKTKLVKILGFSSCCVWPRLLRAQPVVPLPQRIPISRVCSGLSFSEDFPCVYWPFLFCSQSVVPLRDKPTVVGMQGTLGYLALPPATNSGGHGNRDMREARHVGKTERIRALWLVAYGALVASQQRDSQTERCSSHHQNQNQ